MAIITMRSFPVIMCNFKNVIQEDWLSRNSAVLSSRHQQ